jgi:N-acetylmuramoyl-L-alanine amidase
MLEFEFFRFVPHNWRVSKFAVIIFCGALVLLAGCATSPNELPPDWSSTNEVQQVTNALPTKSISSVIQTNLPPAPNIIPRPIVATNPPPATNIFKPRPAPILTWTSLSRWAAAQKIGQPRLLSKSPLTTYAISSDQGTMVLAIGSREAVWNGVALHFGFAPEFIDGEVFVHGLDLQKSLEPFLCAAPLAFGTNRVIVIDPGHGGANGGTISIGNRRPEKEFTLDWAKRLKPLLETNGWTVFLTRTNDADVALSNRVAVAESRHADLFVSLHFNSVAPDQKPVGLATFCLTPVGMPSTVTRGFPDVLFQNFPNNNFDAQNVQLAERLQRALLHATGLEDRGVNRARFIGVLRGQHRPAVLIEAGFLSNPREAKRIEQPEFRQKLAEAVAEALK